MSEIERYYKTDLVNDIAAANPTLSRAQLVAVVDVALALIKQRVSDGRAVTLHGFGTWQSVPRAARTGVNMRTKAKITIPASIGVRFSPASSFKAAVRGTAERAAGNRLEEQGR